MNYSVCITTFSLRFHFIEKLVGQIRSFTDCDILIAINGDYKSEFDEKYRKKILKLCSEYKKVFPIFFTEQRGLSKLWNTLIIHSKNDWCLVLNDDVEITGDYVFETTIPTFCSTPTIFRINGSMSHFLIHKNFLHDLGYFDERFLGFGSEDSDFAWRHIEKYNLQLCDINVHGFINIVSDIKDEKIINSLGSKYTAFNQSFLCCYEHSKYKPDENGFAGWFPFPVIKKIDDIQQYPYESFFMEHKNKI
jgi:predicted glycosyltransferase involved in capsule biosynthesis